MYKDNAGNTFETEDDETKTYTWDFNIVKKNEADETLAGVKFVLKATNNADAASSNLVKNGNTYQVCTKTSGCTHNHVTEIVTNSTGTFSITGLDSGTYYLFETAAPDGYNKLAGPVVIKIDGTDKTTPSTVNEVITKEYNTTEDDKADNDLINVIN